MIAGKRKEKNQKLIEDVRKSVINFKEEFTRDSFIQAFPLTLVVHSKMLWRR